MMYEVFAVRTQISVRREVILFLADPIYPIRRKKIIFISAALSAVGTTIK